MACANFRVNLRSSRNKRPSLGYLVPMLLIIEDDGIE